MMPAYIFAIIFVGWIIWVVPFFLVTRNKKGPQTLDRRARWGIFIEMIAFAIVWQPHFWLRQPVPWRIVPAVVFLLLADWLTWTSARTLGRQWRFDAGLNADHQLVRSGAYALVRHPIYASMICMLLGIGFLLTPMPLLLLALGLCVIGTEIRVRIEDQLLANRFGDEFRAYQRSVPAYLPFLYSARNR